MLQPHVCTITCRITSKLWSWMLPWLQDQNLFGEVIALSLYDPNLTGYANSTPSQYESAQTALNMSMSFRAYFILSD